MLRTLFWKETREVLPLAVFALLVQFCLVGTAIGLPLIPFVRSNGVIPFVQDMPKDFMLIVGGLAAVAIGLRQTTRESSGGTYPFLLHRPASRDSIFATKLLVGLAAYSVVGGLPLLCYALWAATPGTHASPFRWSMTTMSWGVLAELPLVYFGAFLSGLRPGRWLGSRLLPLAGSLIALVVAQVATVAPWLLAAPVLFLTIGACFVLVILHIAATRDYS